MQNFRYVFANITKLCLPRINAEKLEMKFLNIIQVMNERVIAQGYKQETWLR